MALVDDYRGLRTVAVTIRQVKAARDLLGWTQGELAKQSGVSLPTVQRLEGQGGSLGGYTSTRDSIVGAFERAGIEFLPGGVRLR
jgi:predicted transcriptional regulator